MVFLMNLMERFLYINDKTDTKNHSNTYMNYHRQSSHQIQSQNLALHHQHPENRTKNRKRMKPLIQSAKCTAELALKRSHKLC